jgi:hypothetical protein
MINEETSNKTLHMEMQAAKVTAKGIQKLLKDLMQKLDQQKQSLDSYLKNSSKEVTMKEMVKKGQLEELEVKDSDLKELKKELNKNGVKFSVMKDKETGNHSVFFQAKDTAVMEKAFRNTLATVEKKEAKKDSVIQSIDKYKQAMQLCMYQYCISQIDEFKNRQLETGIWSFAEVNNGVQKVEFTEGNFEDSLVSVKNLILEILNPEIPFTEKVHESWN